MIESNTHVLKREMSITHSEFFRILPSVIGSRAVSMKDKEARITEGERRILIRLSELRERTIGALRLPVTDVELRFFGYTEVETQDFMAGFDLHYRRGGG